MKENQPMVRNRRITLYLSDRELELVQSRANRELSDPGLWMRRVAVAIADGSARVIAKQRDADNIHA
jgi:hypothetical protein